MPSISWQDCYQYTLSPLDHKQICFHCFKYFLKNELYLFLMTKVSMREKSFTKYLLHSWQA